VVPPVVPTPVVVASDADDVAHVEFPPDASVVGLKPVEVDPLDSAAAIPAELLAKRPLQPSTLRSAQQAHGKRIAHMPVRWALRLKPALDIVYHSLPCSSKNM
jgi:hypothetical protein